MDMLRKARACPINLTYLNSINKTKYLYVNRYYVSSIRTASLNYIY